MCARNHTSLAGELAYIVKTTAVRALAIVEHQLPHSSLLNTVERLVDYEVRKGLFVELLFELFSHLVFESVTSSFTFQLGLNEECISNAI